MRTSKPQEICISLGPKLDVLPSLVPWKAPQSDGEPIERLLLDATQWTLIVTLLK